MTETIDHIETGSVELSDGFDAYFRARPSRFRSTLRRRTKLLTDELGALHLQVSTDKGSLAELVKAYGEMEAAGWKGAAGTAVTTDGAQAKFYIEALAEASDQGISRIYALHAGPQIIAMQLALLKHKTLYLLKTTYDESCRKYAPGVLLQYLILEKEIGAVSGVHCVEYYGRVNESQEPWLTNRRNLFHVNVYRRPVLRRLHQAIRQLRSRRAG